MVHQAATGSAGGFNWVKFLTSFDGRIPRSYYWLRFALPYVVLLFVSGGLDMMLGTYNAESGYGVISGIFFLVALWPWIAVTVKRLHDRNRSGWFILIALIPIIGSLYILIECGILKGTTGANRFGPDPLGA
ncbi:MAG: DUF805 domain-containing protein [Rhodospirillaceae bacterium]|nr:DUF805 domain-containing protein [Rhodospirillaceae bacterium]